MRILINIDKADFRFINLVKPLEKLDVSLGVVTGKLDRSIVDRFNPDIVVHNSPSFNMNCANIAVNDITYATLGPFTNIPDSKEDPLFSSDVCYIGDVKDFGSELFELMDRYDFKLFSHVAYSFPSYCGNLIQEDTGNAYRNSKVSIIPSSDFGYREMDIVISDGNPVKFKNRDQFLSDVHDGVNGKRFSSKYTKEQILQNHTNFDKLSEVFKNSGLNQLALKVKELK